MLIAPKPKPADFTAEGVAADPFDVALVVVHGMGNAYKSQILLEWAEPLLERIDWMTRDLAAGAKKDDPRFGVTVARSDLSGPVPIVTATVGVPDADAPDGMVERRIAIVEARWSESFAPMTRRQVFRWAVTFLWRAISRMLVQYGRTVALIPLLRARAHARAALPLMRKIVVVLLDALRFLAGAIVVIALDVVIVALGAVATIVMPLLSPLLLIPWVKERAQEVIDGIIESIGDVATWKERPLRAAAMRLVFRDALDHAARLVGVDPDAEAAAREARVAAGGPRDGAPPSPAEPHVQVLAHSQGAAVAAYALFSDTLVPSDYRVLRLTTVGAAVVLLGRDKWKGRPDEYHPVQAWIDHSRDVIWENQWAVWDPFAAGPIADDTRSARERWRASYFPGVPEQGADAPPDGPAEQAVHNTSQPFLDHAMYYANTLQVVEPAARALLPERFPKPAPEVAYVANRLMVIDRESLGINILLAVVIAACVPGIPAVSRFLAGLVGTVGGWIAALLGVLPFVDSEDALPGWSISFLTAPGDEGTQLSDWGWAFASALLLALLVWLNQLLAGRTTRALLWNRCSPNPWRWLVVSSVGRAMYTLIAALALWFLSSSLNAGQPWLPLVAVVVIVAAIFAFVAPLVAPAPVRVPARRPAPEGAVPPAPVAPEPSRLTLGDSVRSDAFRNEFTTRMQQRRSAYDAQDEADDLRARRESWFWRLRLRVRRRLLRRIEDWFFHPPKWPSHSTPDSAAGATPGASAQP